FSNVRVDEMTDAQVRMFMQQVQASGLGDEQIEQIAAAKGMNPAEIAKLRQRVERLKKQGTYRPQPPDQKLRVVNGAYESTEDDEKRRDDNEPVLTEEQEHLRSKIFGASLFAHANLTFEPNLRMATPVDYQIGPDDEMLIDIYGYS